LLETSGFGDNMAKSIILTFICSIAAFFPRPSWAESSADAAHQNLPAVSMLDIFSNPLVKQVVYDRVELREINMRADGASELSQDWLNGNRKDWAIEFQRGGGNLIIAGVTRNDHELVDAGLRMFEWGFGRQNPTDGGFDESADEFHSTSVFLVEVCRSLLALKDKSNEFEGEMPRVDAMIPRIRFSAQWLLRSDVLGPGRQKDQPFTHRKWLLAFSLGGAAKLSGDQELASAAVRFAYEGIQLQQEDGRNPERGGFDVSYEMVDALVGGYYYTTLSPKESSELMAKVQHMIDKTCQWESRRILGNDQIDPSGSTRIGIEHMHNGQLKQVNYPEVIQAFIAAARICQKSEYTETARRLARGQGWLPADRNGEATEGKGISSSQPSFKTAGP